jgi:hypothetical protein
MARKGLKRRGFTGKVCLYRDEKNIRCCTESEKTIFNSTEFRSDLYGISRDYLQRI